MDEKEKEKLKEEVKEYLNGESDLYDFDSFYDSNISGEENRTIIFKQINELFGSREEITKRKIENETGKIKQLEQNFKETYESEFNILTKEKLSKIKTIAIYGETGTGKTALAYKIISLFEKERQVYFLKHPRPYLIAKRGYKNLINIEALQNLQNCIIFIDEPQLNISIYDHKANKIIAKVCSLARQRNILLIIASSDTRVFSKWNESYFDLWLIKDLDYDMIKNGSKIKRAYRENSILDPRGLRLKDNQFISESRVLSEFNGIHKFNMPDFFNSDLSNPYKIENETAKETENNIAKGLEN